MSKVDKFSPYHDGSMQFDIDGGWVSYDDYKESADRIEELSNCVAVLKTKLAKVTAERDEELNQLGSAMYTIDALKTYIKELKGQDDE